MSHFFHRPRISFLLIVLWLLVGLWLTSAAQAQRACGTRTAEQWEAQLSPVQRLAYQQAEARVRRSAPSPAEAKARITTGGIITIPVVVHVVYNTPGQNVSDAQIQAQLDVLNQDFSRTNADAANTPAAFRARAASLDVQFRLALRDPQGRPTSGVERRQSAVVSWIGDNIKFASAGGLNAWPADQYLNIWLCNLDQGLLGFAQFPGGDPAYDGVVLHYGTVPGGNTWRYNLGRTATHEVGHWLNLFHTFQGGCRNLDRVDDTPAQMTGNGGCPSFPNISCSNGPDGDMFMNYMDYSDDACMNAFTLGQKARVRALFEPGGLRAMLASSVAALLPVAPLPVELTSFTADARAAAVHLRWTTAQERHNAYFAIERAPDGRTFTEIGRVTGQGNSASPSHYAHTDAALPPAAERLYYRLRQVDLDGTTTYSAVRAVRPVAATSAELVTIAPTVVADGQLRYALAVPGELECHTLAGRRVGAAATAAAGAGQLDVGQLPAGVYLVRLSSAAGIRVARFVVP